ncbi:MAG: ABC transporter permease subunit [Chitinophagales bacterium]|nr:ABC transporter permease subunit [Chitinophagales bacterium]
MFWKVLSFELTYWRTRIYTYVFALIVFLLTTLTFSLEGISLGGDANFINSPYSIMIWYYVLCLILPIFINSFVSSGITRDYENKFDQILYSLPVSRTKILLGRFVGGLIVIFLIFLTVPLAELVAEYLPWTDKDMIGAWRLDAHIHSILTMVLPNLIIIGSILFLIASWTRSINSSFLGAIAVVVIFNSISGLNDKIDNKTIAALSDPFGFMPIMYYTKKWSVYEKNYLLFPLDWKYFLNRLLWLSVAVGLWFAALHINKFKLQKTKQKATKKKDVKPSFSGVDYSKKEKDFSSTYFLKNIHFQAKIDFLHIIKSPAFLVTIGLIIMVLVMSFIGTIQTDSGLADQLATTSNTLDILEVVTKTINYAIIFFSGMLIWKERDAKMNDIYDALPVKTYTVFLGKLCSIIYLVMVYSTLLLIIGVAYQIARGVYDIDWAHYAMELYVINLFYSITLAILSMFFQVMINNKFIAYFASAIVVFAEPFLFQWLEISNNMISISPSLPSVIHSDFYGYGSYKTSLFAFMAYWLLIYSVIGFIAYWFYVRGRNTSWRERWQESKKRLKASKAIFSILAVTTTGFIGFMYYQTQMQNSYFGQKERLERMAYYEKKYRHLMSYPVPKATKVDYKIDLFPSKRSYQVKGKMWMVNKDDTSIQKIYLNNDFKHPFKINIKDAKLSNEDKKGIVNFQTYSLVKPLQIGDSVLVEWEYSETNSGVENEISNRRLNSNGTFLDFSSFTPSFGYDKGLEISRKSKREKFGLPTKADFKPALIRECTHQCMKDYIGGMADWVTIYTEISTEDDQIAVAPGEMTKSWKENGRSFYKYDLTQPSKFFFSVVSGKYEILKDTSLGVQCEVYYLPEHAHNTKVMMNALKKSIAYYSQSFGPYKHPVARIIEFPKFSSFAQAFPGTMPYSESIGFTSNIVNNPEDINEVFHIVAHEMAHQWWAHQVVGADMQGSEMLSESISEYASLKLLEKEYGLDMATKFLKESNNNYVFSRAFENKKESSLKEVDGQGYIYYQKGSLVLYAIQQLLGEDKMNMALSNLIKNYGYKEPPYPNSYALLDEIYQLTPDSLKSHIKAGLEEIVIFETDVQSAEVKKLANNNYETTIQFELVKRAADPNAKEVKKIKDIKLGKSDEVAIRDYFDIALYQNTEDKSRYGKFMKKQRYLLNKKNNTLKILSDKKPDKIVIDPYFLHIHKDPEENIKKL